MPIYRSRVSLSTSRQLFDWQHTANISCAISLASHAVFYRRADAAVPPVTNEFPHCDAFPRGKLLLSAEPGCRKRSTVGKTLQTAWTDDEVTRRGLYSWNGEVRPPRGVDVLTALPRRAAAAARRGSGDTWRRVGVRLPGPGESYEISHV